jgi:hypothetical protein
MVQSLNPKAQVVGREKLTAMIGKQYALVKLKIKAILKGIPFSCTTDAWTLLRWDTTNSTTTLIERHEDPCKIPFGDPRE